MTLLINLMIFLSLVNSIDNNPSSLFNSGLHLDNNKDTTSILFCLQAQ